MILQGGGRLREEADEFLADGVPERVTCAPVEIACVFRLFAGLLLLGLTLLLLRDQLPPLEDGLGLAADLGDGVLQVKPGSILRLHVGEICHGLPNLRLFQQFEGDLLALEDLQDLEHLLVVLFGLSFLQVALPLYEFCGGEGLEQT